MALSTKKRNQIIADIKASRFPSVKELLKHYKIGRTTYNIINRGITTSNADVVELGVAYELSKKSAKSVQEVASIEKTVAERVNTIEDDNTIVDNNRKLVRAIQAKLSTKLSDKNTLSVQNLKHASGIVKDCESVANPTTSNTNIEVNNKTQVVTGVKIEFV